MKRWPMWMLLLLLLPAAGTTGPTAGPQRSGIRLPGGSRAEPGENTISFEFEAGQRACVIILGDHNPIKNLGIEVYDQNKRLVAKDDGIGDYAAAIWYPPVTGPYSIRFLNHQDQYNECYLVIR